LALQLSWLSRIGVWAAKAAAVVVVLSAVGGAVWQFAMSSKASEIVILRDRTISLERENDKLQKENEKLRREQKPIGPMAGPAKGEKKSPDIEFKTPNNGDSVVSPVRLEFRVTAGIPNGYYPNVIVMDTRGMYWPWGVALDGVMSGITLGQDTDSGRGFELGVLLTDQELKKPFSKDTFPRHILYRSIKVIRK
jgi:hypothetical protein